MYLITFTTFVWWWPHPVDRLWLCLDVPTDGTFEIHDIDHNLERITLQIFIVILLCKSIKVIGEIYKLMTGKLFCKNYLEI